MATREHPHPHPDWNFSARFPDCPWEYRRSVIKDCIGKARGYLSAKATWRASGKKKGKPGAPTPRNHPTLYEGTCSLQLEGVDLRNSFVRLRVYTGLDWQWVNYPTRYSRYFEQRRTESDWQALSPKLVLTKTSAAIHFPQRKTIEAKKVVERKRDPDLVTVAVDLNVKNLAVITVRHHGIILESRFLTDHGLDQQRYRHLRRVAKKQWQSGKAVKGEQSNQDLWRHIRHMNEAAAHQVSHRIAQVCARYPGCVLLFERLRKIKPKGESKSRRMNRRCANQLRGKINQYAKQKAYEQGIVTVEVKPGEPVSSVAAVEPKARDSRFRVGSGCGGRVASCSGVRSVTTAPMRTTMAVPTCITASLLSSVGNPKPNASVSLRFEAITPCSAICWVGEGWGGQSLRSIPGPYADAHTCESGGACADLEGARSSLHALSDGT